MKGIIALRVRHGMQNRNATIIPRKSKYYRKIERDNPNQPGTSMNECIFRVRELVLTFNIPMTQQESTFTQRIDHPSLCFHYSMLKNKHSPARMGIVSVALSRESTFPVNGSFQVTGFGA